jgi:shikimate dehydrogenase
VPDSPTQPIVCCIGQPVAGNPTQFMMERAFVAAGLDWRYLTLEVPPDKLVHAMLGVRALGFFAANIASPHKEAVIHCLDRAEKSAELTGLVSCVSRSGQHLIGENVDGKGFVQALRPKADPTGKKAVILGAGSAARVIAVELGLAGASELVIVNRSADRGHMLVDLLNQQVRVPSRFVHLSGDYSVEPDTRIVVNATSIGSADPEALVPLDIQALAADVLVADVAFSPLGTRLLRDAAGRGCKTLNSLAMLVGQAMISFKIWTGVDPDPVVMQEALEEYLEI